MDAGKFGSLEEEVVFLRAHVHVTRLVDDLLEDCLQQRMGLAAALGVFTSQCRRLLGATAAVARLVGTTGPVLTLTDGEIRFDVEEALADFGIRSLGGQSLFVKKLALGNAWLGTFVVAMPPPPSPKQVMALVEAMGEQLDSAVLGFLALAEGRSPAERLDELNRDDAFRPRTHVGRYELLLPLGAGGMGQVFVARQPAPEGLGRLVALKRVLPHLREDEESVARFLDEGRIGLRLSHPNLVTVHEFGRAAAGDFLVMELVRGVTLRALLDKVGPLSPAEAVGVIVQALRGLHAAHELCDEQGAPMALVHRDLSSRNVMIGFDGRVKVLDFGVARSDSQRYSTEAGELRGKLRYLSPEQASGGALDRRSDLFSAGVVLYESLTGRTPFDGTPTEIIAAVVAHPVPEAPGIPAKVWAALQRAMAKDRKRRPATALELAADLELACAPVSEEALGRRVTEAFPALADATVRWDALSVRERPSEEDPA